MADEAVLDAPVLDVDAGAEVVETEQTDATPEATEEAPVEVAEVKGDERTMPKWLRSLKESDPEGFKDAKAKFFTLRELDGKLKDFDLDSAKSFLEEYGSIDTVRQTIAEREEKAKELDAINEAIAEGRPDILDRVPQEALAKLAPVVAEKWAQADPDGWARAMSGVMAATIQQSGVPSFLREMELMLKYNDTATLGESLAKLRNWAESFQQKASAPVEQKPQQQKQPDVNQERQQWELQKFESGLKDEVQKLRDSEIERSLADYIKRAPNDADKKQLCIASVRREVIDRLSADQDYQSKLNGLIARKDKDGAMRIIKSRESKAIEEIAPRIGRAIFGQPAQAKPAAVATPVTKRAELPKRPLTRSEVLRAALAD